MTGFLAWIYGHKIEVSVSEQCGNDGEEMFRNLLLELGKGADPASLLLLAWYSATNAAKIPTAFAATCSAWANRQSLGSPALKSWILSSLFNDDQR